MATYMPSSTDGAVRHSTAQKPDSDNMPRCRRCIIEVFIVSTRAEFFVMLRDVRTMPCDCCRTVVWKFAESWIPSCNTSATLARGRDEEALDSAGHARCCVRRVRTARAPRAYTQHRKWRRGGQQRDHRRRISQSTQQCPGTW